MERVVRRKVRIDMIERLIVDVGLEDLEVLLFEKTDDDLDCSDTLVFCGRKWCVME